MALVIPGVLMAEHPLMDGASEGAAPVVFDSPHSGTEYPADFAYAAPLSVLRRAEDAFVDELFAGAPRHGAGFLRALFPRSYVDPNRHEHEIDPKLLAEPWPHDFPHSPRAERGLGVVRRLVRATVPVYDRALTVGEIQARIDSYHRPYHDALKEMLDATHAHYGALWHVNCHSMKGSYKGKARSDFVIGDRDGTSCGGEFTALVAETLRELGYRVGLNSPFKGAEIIIRHGAPQRNRHSLQIEVNRSLYMDEERIEKSSGFEKLKRDIDSLIAAVTGYARENLPARADAEASQPMSSRKPRVSAVVRDP
ncbi:MAG TPA: N-formylglutamate amidohydrolase [Dongiaceae bacterium]